MSILSCPVCGAPLAEKEKNLLCDKGHSFDIAKEGYVNLLLGAKGQHGDNRLMLDGRRRFLENGYYRELRLAVFEEIQKRAKAGCTLLDVGCGEGYYTAAMANAIEAYDGTLYGFDVSRDAVRLAAKRKCGRFFVGSAYKMPVRENSIDILTLLFSPFCREEILRVLKKNGIFIMAIPGRMHLYGLKEAVYDTPYPNEVADADIDGFSLLARQHIENEITLTEKALIEALFSMTPYYYKTSPKDREKLSHLDTLKTKIEFELLVYQKI